jgi:glucose-1-phosphate thymidylyltransferase
MIDYAIETLVKSGITEIMLVCGGNNAGDFLKVVGNGEQYGLKHISYTYQKESGGIAQAISLCEYWANDDPICVILGDNILENSFPEAVKEFNKSPKGARIFLTEVKHPEWYGVVELDRNSNIVNIIEKPKAPKSNLIAIGVYIYDNTVWKHIRSLSKSTRGELEVTDLNLKYLKSGKLTAVRIKGFWIDCGESIDTYLDACNRVRELKI